MTDLKNELRGVYGVWLREFIIFRREKSRVIASLVTPLMWLLIIGSGIGSIADEELTGGDYTTFIFPGIIAMSVLFGTVFFGLYIVWDRKVDALKEILVAPVSRTSIFVGKVLGGSTDAMIQAAILLVIGVFLVDYSLASVIAALGIILFTAVALCSLGLSLGSFFESFEGFQITSSFLIFPMFFLSGALYPVSAESLPTWLLYVARINPVTYPVDALRGVLIGQHVFPYTLTLGVLTGFCAATIALGTWSFNRMKL